MAVRVLNTATPLTTLILPQQARIVDQPAKHHGARDSPQETNHKPLEAESERLLIGLDASAREINLIVLNMHNTIYYGPVRTRPYFAKLIDKCVNHKLSRVRTDDISGTNFRPGQTNIKGSDGLPLRRAVLEQRANPH